MSRFVSIDRAVVLSLLLTGFNPAAPSAEEPLTLQTRTREETGKGTGRFRAVTREETWLPSKTAIVICDMWDRHWCAGATRRVAQMAPRMNETIAAARKKGVLIIHCPSDTMDFYKGTPAREIARSAPTAEPRPPVPDRCPVGDHQCRLPINDLDGGCDCQPRCKQGSPWRRQIADLAIEPGDAVTDSGEAFNLMRQRGIDNVIVMGVHTNMCVLGRPFAIKKLVQQGQKVVLMRDLTDTMYNSRSAPYVSHFTGTDLVVEHIEKNWCPSITSADLIGGEPFRSPDDSRKRIAVIMAEDEYRTEESLPKFAFERLGKDFEINLVFGDESRKDSIPGLDILKDCDAALVSVRRRPVPKSQLDLVRAFVREGKPVVGIRTASHAFSLRDNKPPAAGLEAWPEFDREVFGGNYHGHYGPADGPKTVVQRADEEDPILAGVPAGEFSVGSWLYRTAPLATGARVLATGRLTNQEKSEPVAWTFTRADGGRSFYASLGSVEDFKIEPIARLIANGTYWAAGLKTEPGRLLGPVR